MFSVGAKDKTWMPMMRLQAEQWTLWFPSARRGQGVLYFYRLRIDAVMAECESTLLGARMGDAMGSIQGFRCGQCRAEVLATPVAGNLDGRLGWTPPVLCCGRPLWLLDTGQVLSATLLPRRVARCPRCGYQVRLIVQPTNPLVCMICQTDLVTSGESPDRNERRVPVGAPANASR